MTQQKPINSNANPAVAELKALRNEFARMREELTGLRSELSSRKMPDITDQVAKGVVLAGVFWGVLFLFFRSFV
ncbi:hypothetical protein H6F43_00550 [Leptolyngbya sp. FACHB-36]|uniref:hypothetical protein n=1 Tax=Leptolyngbya sp. FACHB-36 TaxID=2692808 RepID=UPI001680F005|nr:hypothetical protein [Leptolyngbya sp. FACHB-36]MBD2018673.1 hypothetical protein [Leptolyngbya sp. FACHB-36]